MDNKNSHWGELYQKDVNKKGENLPYILGKINK